MELGAGSVHLVKINARLCISKDAAAVTLNSAVKMKRIKIIIKKKSKCFLFIDAYF